MRNTPNCSPRAASLDEEALFAAVTHDVPHDQEIAFEPELLDEHQFAFELAMRAFPEIAVAASVALMLAFSGTLAQERHHRLAVGHRVTRELVAKIFQREFEMRGNFLRVGNRLRKIGK